MGRDRLEVGGNCKEVSAIEMEVCEVEWGCKIEERKINERVF